MIVRYTSAVGYEQTVSRKHFSSAAHQSKRTPGGGVDGLLSADS
jgi:hypothetical protein